MIWFEGGFSAANSCGERARAFLGGGGSRRCDKEIARALGMRSGSCSPLANRRMRVLTDRDGKLAVRPLKRRLISREKSVNNRLFSMVFANGAIQPGLI
jgi:hypothetical protein